MVLLEQSRTSTAPSAFAVGDVSGKVWSTLITTQQEGTCPKSSLGFAAYTRKLYHANILALRVLSVKLVAKQHPTNGCTIHILPIIRGTWFA